MHNVTLDTPIPSVAKAVEILTYNTGRLGVPIDYDRMLEYWAYYTLKGNRLKERVVRYINPVDKSNSAVINFKSNDFLAFLQRSGVSEGFLSTPKGAPSMSSDSLQAVIDTRLYSREIVRLIELWKEAEECNGYITQFKTIAQDNPIVPIETWDNHRMVICKPIWVPQNTGRIGSQRPATMNIKRDVGDIYTVPKGWVYFEADSGQIEPRIIQSYILDDPQLKHCTMLYNDAYYGYLQYTTVLTDAQRRSGTLDIQAMEITDAMKDKRSKFKTFGNATMYGSTENRDNDPDKAAFIKYIGGHPNRIAFQSRIEKQIDNGQRIFNTAFGTPIDITKGPSEAEYPDKSSDAYRAHLIRCAINNPVQGTAADLMRFSILKTNAMFQRSAPNSVILQYVHDAGKFAIAESDYNRPLSDDSSKTVIQALQGVTAYQVPGWIPIYCDPQEGAHGAALKRFI